jgi:hypothetical protein
MVEKGTATTDCLNVSGPLSKRHFDRKNGVFRTPPTKI